ncbi:MAG: TIGR04282 family arsenosugar biosynthesis glycosyltransferase [Hyphomicrobiaceae bacterium]
MATRSSHSPRLAALPRLRPNRPETREADAPREGLRHASASAANWRRRLVIMVKAPEAGRVKTRLASEIGVVGATSFYRHASSAVVRRLGADPRWQTVLAVAPDTATGARYWPAPLPRRPQGPGDLGRRMQVLFDRLPPGPVVIIGSDCPAVRPDDIASAFTALGRADAVLGPATDGGYWLVGEWRSPKSLPAFSGVRWSSEQTLDDTVANFASRRVAFVRELPDVDTAADLARLNGKGARRIHAAP